MTREQIVQVLEEMPDAIPIGQQHDLRRPPIARAVDERLEEHQGELAIVADIEVFDEAAFAGFGGISIALGRPVHQTSDPTAVTISFNPRQLDRQSLFALTPLNVSGLRVEFTERTEKTAGLAEFALVYVVCQIPIEMWKGFWNAAGTNLWEQVSKLWGRADKDGNPIQVAVIDHVPDLGLEVIVSPEPGVEPGSIGDIGSLIADVQALAPANRLVCVAINVPASGRPFVEFAVDVSGTTIYPAHDDSVA